MHFTISTLLKFSPIAAAAEFFRTLTPKKLPQTHPAFIAASLWLWLNVWGVVH